MSEPALSSSTIHLIMGKITTEFWFNSIVWSLILLLLLTKRIVQVVTLLDAKSKNISQFFYMVIAE